MNERCVCGARARKIKTRLELYDGDVIINGVDALYCPECNEELMTTDQVARARERLRETLPEFQAFSIRKKIAKVGNSLTIPLAKELIDYVNLKKGQEVRITLKNKNRLIVDVA
jgi:YgiT-type zinc finger domain-containing protein